MEPLSPEPKSEFRELLQAARDGDSMATGRLFERYFARLVALARSRMQPQECRDADEEDAAVSALVSFWQRFHRGDFQRLEDEDQLWSLLARIVLRKVNRRRRYQRADKRGPRTSLGGFAEEPSTDSAEPLGARRGARLQNDPEGLIIAHEVLDRLLDSLADPLTAQVLLLRLEGFTYEEIAERLGRSTRWVMRRMQRIRTIWESLDREDHG
jgi:RNA polymerase sigma factor (sigma-70 family)